MKTSIELPCNIGNELYVLEKFTNVYLYERKKVAQINICKNGFVQVIFEDGKWVDNFSFGEEVFLYKKQAIEKCKELNK